MSLSWSHPAASHRFRVTAGRDPRHLLVQVSDLRDEGSETRGLEDMPATVRTPSGAPSSVYGLDSGLLMDDTKDESHLAKKLPAPSTWALISN